MANLLLVVVCLVAGMLARRTGRFPDATPGVLNRAVIDIALPALTFVSIHRLGLHFEKEVLVALLAPWAYFAVALVVLIPVTKLFGWSKETRACLLLTAGLANTSFVGFPLVEALFGRDALSTAVWVDQGQFLVLSTAGVFVAALAAGGARPTASSVAKRVVAFPPFIAFVAALVLAPVRVPSALFAVLERLGSLVVPLALLAVGWWLTADLAALREHGRKLVVGLAVRLLVAPAVVVLVLLEGLDLSGRASHVIIAESAMAPMITGAMLAMDAELDPKLASLMVSIGVPLSLLSVPAWIWLLG